MSACSPRMKSIHHLIGLPITGITMTFISFFGVPGYTATKITGAKGAQIYCFMRKNGNSHTVSWNAAYEVIKRQTNSLFKTSPKHGAVMIIEAVVESPGNFANCGQYLGNLFDNPNELSPILNDSNVAEKEAKDRYSY